ncbi:MAG: AMP-binding protein [Spirochaetaceae bacterium]|jgi:acyl-coenzyme A synthetase/AMP-(fatty) acid ligase|nr:AMP-binding protein [Spirochaetaceae bacterium]
MIFRFALRWDKTLRGSLAEKRVEAYCRKVTRVWCLFFIINGGIAAFTVFFASDTLWSLYNGGISYIFIGILFGGELMVRKGIDKTMPRAVPLSQMNGASRPADRILCYDGTFTGGIYKTWGDFLADTARLRRFIGTQGAEKWILHAEDCWFFLVGFAALFQCKKEVLLTANIQAEYLAEIREGGTAVLTDQDLAGSFSLPALLAPGGEPVPPEPPPAINRDETVILMYTSGTTGKPKVVRQRLTEFEIDNAFILSKWGEEFLSRKVCSTVSQHHIYGLLFSILLPFTAGVPFRRFRLRYPEELETLTDDAYMIITVPAFLKRTVEIAPGDGEKRGGLRLRSPWIFTSGGVLDPETARKTDEVLGFWPLEVYGSTETSGIAFRQSRDGLAWTPFDNAHITLNEAGCLVIRSPYIKDPAGFTTGDLAELLPDGRFLLRGRADSMVKIEEKRISLPEVESRLLQSGLVAEVSVLAMEDKRQYLAAALVLNPAGVEKFRHTEKYLVNRYFREYLSLFFEGVVIPRRWRYLDALPTDSQGKKKRDEIQALFARPEPAEREALSMPGLSCLQVLDRTDTSVTLELALTSELAYFDGHFPEFQLLPAVAQLELALRFADRYFGTGVALAGAGRIKFSAMIRPGSRVFLKLNHDPDKGTLNFAFSFSGETGSSLRGTNGSPKGTVCSSGILRIPRPGTREFS